MLSKLLSRLRPAPAEIPGPEPARPEPSHAGGPAYTYTQDEIAQHVPKLELQYYDLERGQVMDEKQVSSARQAGTLQPIFYNPNTDLDYIVLFAMVQNTVVGNMVDTLTNFVTGGSVKPEIELLNPTDDPAKDQKTLEKYRYIIEELRAIERAIERDNDITLIDYLEQLISNTITYGRCAVIVDKATQYNGIATNYRTAHPRDLSITVFDAATWNLKSVLWRHVQGETVPASKMIYLWNPLTTGRYHNAHMYGGSMLLPLLDASRVLRTIIAQDLPALARAAYGGMFVMAVRPQGQTLEQKRAEYRAIVDNMKPASPMILVEDPENLSFNPIDFNPKYEELLKTCEFLVKYCMSCMGLGSAQHYDEGDSNRSASRTRIQVALASTINPLRERFGRMICNQTYQRWFEQMHPDLMDKIRIKLVWGELQVSEQWDKLEGALRLDSRKELTDNAFGKMIEHADYANMVKPDAETHPGGMGEKPHNIARDNDGKNLDQGVSKNKEGLA